MRRTAKPTILLNYKLGTTDDAGDIQRGIQRLAQYFTGQGKTYRALAWLARNRERISITVTADISPGVGPGYNVRCPDHNSYEWLQQELYDWAEDLKLYGSSGRISVARLLRTLTMPGNLEGIETLLRSTLQVPVAPVEPAGDSLWEVLSAPKQQVQTWKPWEL